MRSAQVPAAGRPDRAAADVERRSRRHAAAQAEPETGPDTTVTERLALPSSPPRAAPRSADCSGLEGVGATRLRRGRGRSYARPAGRGSAALQGRRRAGTTTRFAPRPRRRLLAHDGRRPRPNRQLGRRPGAAPRRARPSPTSGFTSTSGPLFQTPREAAQDGRTRRPVAGLRSSPAATACSCPSCSRAARSGAPTAWSGRGVGREPRSASRRAVAAVVGPAPDPACALLSLGSAA